LRRQCPAEHRQEFGTLGSLVVVFGRFDRFARAECSVAACTLQATEQSNKSKINTNDISQKESRVDK
jgi:hypothetical protein